MWEEWSEAMFYQWMGNYISFILTVHNTIHPLYIWWVMISYSMQYISFSTYNTDL